MKYLILLILLVGCTQIESKNEKAEELAFENPNKEICYRYKKSDPNGLYCVIYKNK